MVYCSTICYEPFGMNRENAEELCGFADYLMDNIIDQEDVIECDGDVQPTDF